MERWKELEFEYAQRLRTCDAAERRGLYARAYSDVASQLSFASDDPEDRTAGTSAELVGMLRRFVDRDDDVLEVGCGRGYTCLKLGPHVRTIVGTDVSRPALAEARATLARHGVDNATIESVSALDLQRHFGPRRFDTAISIEVVEHLHPEDAADHVAQVYALLKPGGKYAVVMPSRIDGPHDITREEFPNATEASGFHLNETTYGEMQQVMRDAGFTRFRSFMAVPRSGGRRMLVLRPVVNEAMERLYPRLPTGSTPSRLIRRFLGIQLVGYKPA